MKKRVKMAGIVGAVLLAAAAFVYAALRPLQVEAVVMGRETVSLTFTETGSYEYSRVFSLYPLVAGEVLEVVAREGDRVKAGDVIAVVDAADYEHQIRQLNSAIVGYQGQLSNLWLQEEQEKAGLTASLRSLEGQLVALEAEIAKNQSNSASLETQISIQERIVSINRSGVSHARDYVREMRDYGDDHELAQARQAFNNAQNLMAQNQLLLEQLREGDIPEDIYEGQRMAIQAQIDSVGQQLERSYSSGMTQYYNAQIEATRLSIVQMEEKAGQATIASPIDGVLFSLPVQDQNLLTQQTLVAGIGNAPMVEVFVPIREVDGIAVGDSVELILDKRLGAQTVMGAIADMEEEAQTKISALGVEERKVRVLIEPVEKGMQIGYDMDVRFTPHTFEDVFVVPKTALFQLEGRDFVWVIAADRLEYREVEKGAETREGYIIDSGLLEGEAVVADCNSSDLRAGKRAIPASIG